MRSTVVTTGGLVACPKCGAVNSFTAKRTGKAKLLGVATVGFGVVAMPKRLKCNGCGANLKRGGGGPAHAVRQPRTRTASQRGVPASARLSRSNDEKPARPHPLV